MLIVHTTTTFILKIILSIVLISLTGFFKNTLAEIPLLLFSLLYLILGFSQLFVWITVRIRYRDEGNFECRKMCARAGTIIRHIKKTELGSINFAIDCVLFCLALATVSVSGIIFAWSLVMISFATMLRDDTVDKVMKHKFTLNG